MPNRILRDGILASEAVASLDWPAEVFYRRLMSVADDYGRTDANPVLIRSRCYPLQTDTVRNADISRWMAACQKAGLILVYAVDGKQFVEIARFGQQTRTASKFPAPTERKEALLANDINCYQMISNDSLGGGGGGGVFEDGGGGGKVGSDEPSPASRAALSDAEWLEALRTMEAYRGIDVSREFSKMVAWCGVHRKEPTHRRFLNWLNKVDRPMQAVNGKGQTPGAPKLVS